jgi:hypothetical protein
MTHLPVSRELQRLPQPGTRQSTSTPWNRFVAAFNSSDLPIIVALCLAGLLLTLNFMFRHPDVGALIQQYNMF